MCIFEELILNYVSVKIKNKSKSALKIKTMAEKLWIKNEIKNLYIKKGQFITVLYKIHLKLTSIINTNIVLLLFQEIKNLIKPGII